MWQLTLLFFLALASAAASAPPDCSSERDGQYEDEDNCAGFYRCQDGELSREDCPWGLFFNADTSLCDWALAVGCELSTSEIESLRLPQTIDVFYTSDDFPSYNYGSENTLNAAYEGGVPITFMGTFETLEYGDVDYKENAIVRALLEGHRIGDHSYDHMGHNNADGGGVYDDVDLDASYFGQMNLDALLDVMERYGFSSQDMDDASEFFLQWARLPNDNSWRIEDIRVGCVTCAPPPTSSLAAMQVADKLQEEDDKYVVGWDLPFYTDYANKRYFVSANRMIMQLLAWPTARKNKVVILDHTFMHDFDEEYGRENYDTLIEFFRLAKIVGFEFKTLEEYLD